MKSPSEPVQALGCAAACVWCLIVYIVRGGGPINALAPLMFFAVLCVVAVGLTVAAAILWFNESKTRG